MVGAVASSYAMCQMAYEICEETNYDIGKINFAKHGEKLGCMLLLLSGPVFDKLLKQKEKNRVKSLKMKLFIDRVCRILNGGTDSDFKYHPVGIIIEDYKYLKGGNESPLSKEESLEEALSLWCEIEQMKGRIGTDLKPDNLQKLIDSVNVMVVSELSDVETINNMLDEKISELTQCIEGYFDLLEDEGMAQQLRAKFRCAKDSSPHTLAISMQINEMKQILVQKGL
jgi:hypothetical protein